ncbi:MAG: hypothetical protein P4L51_22990 [Puia sp.]|nr:hypothetical protein [Puia sp.]
MAINQNHLFEELDGVKCAIVEKNVPEQRAAFLQVLLAYNGYTVVRVPSPPPKAAAGPVGPAPAVPAPAVAQAPIPGASSPAPVASTGNAAPVAAASSSTTESTTTTPLRTDGDPLIADYNLHHTVSSNRLDEPSSSVSLLTTYTIGVTDTTFNPINAVFGRLLRAPGGDHVVTLAYWQQKEKESHDEIPYFETGKS